MSPSGGRIWKPRIAGPRSLSAARLLLIVAEDGVCAGAADPTLGWGSVAAGGVEVISTPGDHFSLLRPPHVQALVERMRGRAADAHLRRNREEGSALIAV